MSDDSEEEVEESTSSVMYNTFRKAMMGLAILFVAWTYITKSSVHRTTAVVPKAERGVIKEAPKDLTDNTAIAAAPPAPQAQQPMPAMPDNRDAEIKLLRERIDQLETKVATPQPAQTDKADKESVTHLQEQLLAQEKSMQDMKAQIDNITAKSTRELSALTSFGILKDAIRSGEPFTAQLNQLYKLLPADAKNADNIRQLLDGLKPYAEKGVPTWPVLQQQFSDLLPIALDPDHKDNSWQKNLRSLIRIRKVGDQQQGSDDESILARAEAKLDRRDINAALKEMEPLSKPAAYVLAPWRENATAFITADSAINALQLALIAEPNA